MRSVVGKNYGIFYTQKWMVKKQRKRTKMPKSLFNQRFQKRKVVFWKKGIFDHLVFSILFFIVSKSFILKWFFLNCCFNANENETFYQKWNERDNWFTLSLNWLIRWDWEVEELIGFMTEWYPRMQFMKQLHLLT